MKANDHPLPKPNHRLQRSVMCDIISETVKSTCILDEMVQPIYSTHSWLKSCGKLPSHSTSTNQTLFIRISAVTQIDAMRQMRSDNLNIFDNAIRLVNS